ncbi:DMT family transporter [Rhodobacteraceae bacterium CCMM004]|nr:DMT family transporter [Rhodobacteraceae bacterium CCMM004]
MAPTPTPFNWLSIAVLGVVWGGTFMVIELALRGHGPVTIGAARATLGAVSLTALATILRRPWPRTPRVWAYAVPVGLFTSAVPFFLLGWGQQYVSSAFAGLSMAALPLFVLPLAHLFSDEPLSGRAFGGVLLGFAGALVLIGPGLGQFGGGTAEPWGQAACLGAAFSYAMGSILTRRCPPVDSVALSAMTLTVGAVVMVPAALIFEGVPTPAGGLPDLALLLLGLVPTAFATLLRVHTIRSAGSVFMTLVNYQVPLWAMAFGALVLAEALPWRFFAALALILTGLAVSQWRALRPLLTGRG